MKLTEIEIDDSQTGYCWIQIYVKNRREAASLRTQILKDQAIKERLHEEIRQCQDIIKNSSSKMETTVQNFVLEKLLKIQEGNDEN